MRKTYGTASGVQDVSFAVNAGEIFGVIGPHGAGKTTTVECISGLRVPDSGVISVLGLDPRADRAAVRECVGVQLQESSLAPFIKAGEVLDLFASFYRQPADPAELMDALGLASKRDTRFRRLSGGLKQRLSIALALIGNPQIAVLDELTTGLDPPARRDTWQLIEHVRDRGVTVQAGVTEVEHEGQRIRVTGTGDLVSTVIRALQAAGVEAREVQVESATLDAYVRLIHHADHDRKEVRRP